MKYAGLILRCGLKRSCQGYDVVNFNRRLGEVGNGMKFDSKADKGVFALASLIAEAGWIFRPQDKSDVGIDALIEIVRSKEVTGQIIAVQIKTGDSYLKETASGLAFYVDDRHVDYWLKLVLPVIVVFYSVDEKILRWVHVTPNNIRPVRYQDQKQKKNYKLLLTPRNVLNRNTVLDLLSALEESPGRGSRDPFLSTGDHVRRLVEGVVADLQLRRWCTWIERACDTHLPVLPGTFVRGARQSRAKHAGRIFPEGYNEDISKSMFIMIEKANDAVAILTERAEYFLNQDCYMGVHAYKRIFPNRNYQADNKDHREWIMVFVRSIEEFAKSVNLFCDIVRKHVDSNFMMDFGRFPVAEELDWYPSYPEYSHEEKVALLPNSYY